MLIPDERRVVKVISVFKKRVGIVTSDYRDITLINTTYTIYGKIINEKIGLIEV